MNIGGPSETKASHEVMELAREKPDLSQLTMHLRNAWGEKVRIGM